MAKRPLFIVNSIAEKEAPLVLVELVDFEWFSGMAKSQKQKSIESLHAAASQSHNLSLLEVSSKSPKQLGVHSSAFNLGFVHRKSSSFVSVESAFQGSKVFEQAGPFPELYEQSAREAKQYFRTRDFGQLIRFDFYGQNWPLNPMTLFYDWLYLSSMHRNREMAKEILQFDGFTDIEFNPKKSINCQAYSAALYVALERNGKLEDALEGREAYIDMMKDTVDWVEQTEYARFHKDLQGKLL